MKARSRLSKVDVAKAAFLVMEVLVIPLVFFGGCGRNSDYYGMARISPLVEQWRADVETYAEEFGVSGYVELLLAIIAQESGGDVEVTAAVFSQCRPSWQLDFGSGGKHTAGCILFQHTVEQKS